MKKKIPKVIVIGWDGADWGILSPLMEKGVLPTLKKMCSQGRWGNLESIINPATVLAFPSFITGTNPGKHGLFDFVKRRDGDYTLEPISPSVMKEPRI